MNPRLIKFAVELQTGEEKFDIDKKSDFTPKASTFFFNFFQNKNVTVPIKIVE